MYLSEKIDKNKPYWVLKTNKRKEKYDEQFLKYCSKRDGSSKFKPISMKDFKKRFTD